MESLLWIVIISKGNCPNARVNRWFVLSNLRSAEKARLINLMCTPLSKVPGVFGKTRVIRVRLLVERIELIL